MKKLSTRPPRIPRSPGRSIPTTSWGTSISARILARTKRYDEAEVGFKKALSPGPKPSRIMIELAVLFERQRKIPEAIEVCTGILPISSPPGCKPESSWGNCTSRNSAMMSGKVHSRRPMFGCQEPEVGHLGLIRLARGQARKRRSMFLAVDPDILTEYRLIYLLGTTYEGNQGRRVLKFNFFSC